MVHLYHEHFRKIRENILRLDLGAKILVVGDYNLPTIRWKNVNGEIISDYPQNNDTINELFSTLAICSLQQFNSIMNANNVILDLVLCNLPTNKITVVRSNEPLVPEDNHHPTLSISLDLAITYMVENSARIYNYRRANYSLIIINWLILIGNFYGSSQ